MPQLQFDAKNLCFLGMQFESKQPDLFKELAAKAGQDRHTQLVMGGLVILDRLRDKAAGAKHGERLPVAQIAASIGLMTSNPSSPGVDIQEFKNRIKFHELKEETLEDAEEQREFNQQIEESGLDVEDALRGLDLSDVDGQTPDYWLDSYTLTELKVDVAEPKGSSAEDDEPDGPSMDG